MLKINTWLLEVTCAGDDAANCDSRSARCCDSSWAAASAPCHPQAICQIRPINHGQLAENTGKTQGKTQGKHRNPKGIGQLNVENQYPRAATGCHHSSPRAAAAPHQAGISLHLYSAEVQLVEIPLLAVIICATLQAENESNHGRNCVAIIAQSIECRPSSKPLTVPGYHRLSRPQYTSIFRPISSSLSATTSSEAATSRGGRGAAGAALLADSTQ